MSQYQRTVCELILEESFGEIVKEVGSHLLRHGGQKLSDLVKELKLQKPQVKYKISSHFFIALPPPPFDSASSLFFSLHYFEGC